jgi:phenylalanyl-tRNA synthetase beta chain
VEAVWSDFRMKKSGPMETPALHPKRIIRMSNGLAGELHPKILKTLGISSRCFVGEWQIEGTPLAKTYPLPFVYPSIDLDASFVASKELTVGEMIKCFETAKAPYLEWVRPYDLFQSEDLKPQKKSMTFAMRYRDLGRTLTLEEAKKSHDELVSAVLRNFSQFEIALR